LGKKNTCKEGVCGCRRKNRGKVGTQDRAGGVLPSKLEREEEANQRGDRGSIKQTREVIRFKLQREIRQFYLC